MKSESNESPSSHIVFVGSQFIIRLSEWKQRRSVTFSPEQKQLFTILSTINYINSKSTQCQTLQRIDEMEIHYKDDS